MSYPNEILRPEDLSPEERERVLSVLDISPEVVDDERLSYAYRPTVPLLDIVKPSRGRAGRSVNVDDRIRIAAILIIAGIVGLILGWITAPFGLVPT
jgi:hypothetical protein